LPAPSSLLLVAAQAAYSSDGAGSVPGPVRSGAAMAGAGGIAVRLQGGKLHG